MGEDALARKREEFLRALRAAGGDPGPHFSGGGREGVGIPSCGAGTGQDSMSGGCMVQVGAPQPEHKGRFAPLPRGSPGRPRLGQPKKVKFLIFGALV